MTTAQARPTALAELEAARSPAVDPRLRADFLRLLRAVPGALHRDGDARSADGRRLHLTASAIVTDRDAEHVALLWHRKGRFWVQPGGHVEHDETSLEAAARREVAEEIGLTDLERVGEGPALLHAHELSPGFGPCGAHWDVLHLLRCPLPADRVPLRPSAESPAVIWAPWPRGTDGRHGAAELPEGTVADMPEKLRALADVLDDAPYQRTPGSDPADG